MEKTTEMILRTRMHGLYLTRGCPDITRLARELLGMHCWFHRNAAFSAVIRGAELTGWKTALTKTWLYRGTLHGTDYDDLPTLLALHADAALPEWLGLSESQLWDMMERITRLMEDGVYSRAEMRRIFSWEFDPEILGRIFSSWGGIFVPMARMGKVAFRSMTSRDFDLIAAEPTQSREEVLPGLLRRYFAAYGPATLADAAWFFGLDREAAKRLGTLDLDELERLEVGREVYYYTSHREMGDIPRVTLLSGFDPLIVSYVDRSAVLPEEYKKAVILKSGICLPTIAIDGQVAGTWNLKKNEPVLQFFREPPRALRAEAEERVEEMRWHTAGQL